MSLSTLKFTLDLTVLYSKSSSLIFRVLQLRLRWLKVNILCSPLRVMTNVCPDIWNTSYLTEIYNRFQRTKTEGLFILGRHGRGRPEELWNRGPRARPPQTTRCWAATVKAVQEFTVTAETASLQADVHRDTARTRSDLGSEPCQSSPPCNLDDGILGKWQALCTFTSPTMFSAFLVNKSVSWTFHIIIICLSKCKKYTVLNLRPAFVQLSVLDTGQPMSKMYLWM